MVTPAEGEEPVIGGKPVHGRHSFGDIPGRGGVNAVREAVIEVARRGGNDIVRPRHKAMTPGLYRRGFRP